MPLSKFGGATRCSVAAAAALVLLVVVPAGLRAAEDSRGFSPVTVGAAPASPARSDGERTRFDKLNFRGGLVLTSTDPRFGGFSGLATDGARLLAISDKANVLQLRLVYREGRLAGISDARFGRLTGSKGQAMPAGSWADSEGLTTGPKGLKGPIWVSFERRHRVERYDFGASGLKGKAVRTRLPAPLDRLPFNSGVEAIARFTADMPQGEALLVFREQPGTRGLVDGVLIGGKKPGPLMLESPGGFAVTDAAVLPGGDLLVLERFYGNLINFRTRIRRIPGKSIKPGARLRGTVLYEAGISQNIDNFEGIAVHRTQDGETRLTIISDDNFNGFQHTLLYQFALD